MLVHASSLLINTEPNNTINDGDGISNIELQFGDTISEQLLWDVTNNRFTLTDDALVQGDLEADGNIIINTDNGAIDAILTFGNDAAAETLRFSDTSNAFEFSDDVTVFGTLSGTDITCNDCLGQTDIGSSAIGTDELKDATASVSGVGNTNIALNDYSFFPNIEADDCSDVNGNMQTNRTNATDDTIGRFRVQGYNCGTGSWDIRWRYITSSDRPEIWAIADASNNLVTVWQSEDPLVYPDNPNPFSGSSLEAGEYFVNLNIPSVSELQTLYGNLSSGDQTTILGNLGTYIVGRGWLGSFSTLSDINSIDARYQESARLWALRYMASHYNVDTAELILETMTVSSSDLQPMGSYTTVLNNHLSQRAVTIAANTAAQAAIGDAEQELDVAGTITGASLVVTGTGTFSDLTNCDTIDTDASGNLICGTDAGSASFDNTVTVAKSGGDYTSIKSAIDSITDASALNRYVVYVYPGTYLESPITMKQYVSVVSVAGPYKTVVYATNPLVELITTTSNSLLQGFALTNVTSNACVFTGNGVEALVRNVIMVNCQIGLHASGSTAHLSMIEIFHLEGSTTTAIKASGGGYIEASGIYLRAGTLTSGVYVTGSGSIADITGLHIDTATHGVHANDGATIRVHGSTLHSLTNALRIGATGTDTRIEFIGGTIVNSVTYDALVENANSSLIVASATLDRNKLSLEPAADITLSFADEQADDEGSVLLGELSVGSPEIPSEVVLGEGDSYTKGMMVYTETTGSSFTDVSAVAASAADSTFTFPGTASNNAIYLSTTRTDSTGVLQPFLGYKLKMGGTALVEGSGEIVHEYWNGSSWTEFSVMCTHADEFYRYGNDCFWRSSISEHVRFNTHIIDDWAVNDPPNTGTNRYWIRLRIANSITTAPVFEQFKIHTNRTEVNGNGTITFHGLTRHRKTFIVSPEAIFYGRGSNAPGNDTFTVGSSPTNWTDERFRIGFDGSGSIDEVTGSMSLPFGLDTSTPLTARMIWKKDNGNSGDVQWHIDYRTVEAIGVLAASGNNTVPAARTVSSGTTGAAGTSIHTAADGSGHSSTDIVRSKFTTRIDVSDFYEGDTLFLRLYRDPDDSDDTYGSHALMVGFEVSGVFWTLGEKVQ